MWSPVMVNLFKSPLTSQPCDRIQQFNVVKASYCPRCSLFHLMTSADLKDHLILPHSLDKEKLGQQGVSDLFKVTN